MLACSLGSRCLEAAAGATISTFTGGDPGEGLDLQGNFIYAVRIGTDQDPGKAGDANFTMDNAPGVTVVAQNQIVNWLQADYGDTPADDVLEIVMHSIRWSTGPLGPTVTLANVTP